MYTYRCACMCLLVLTHVHVCIYIYMCMLSPSGWLCVRWHERMNQWIRMFGHDCEDMKVIREAIILTNKYKDASAALALMFTYMHKHTCIQKSVHTTHYAY